MGARRLGVLVALLCVACGGEGGSAPKKGIVLALGDSIAAGQGFGKADGYPDNPGAYAAIAARRLGWRSANFAISGACAFAPGDPNADPDTSQMCAHSVVRDELPHVRASIRPQVDLLTLTVGANDVEFAACSAHILSPVSLPFDPCAEPRFSKHLGAFERNLTRLLQTLREQFPKARVVMTTIYDPLPPPPSEKSVVCPLVQLGAETEDPKLVTNPAALAERTRELQAKIHDATERIVEGVGAGVDRVAAAAGVSVAHLDFTGHDMCRSQTGGAKKDAWAYGPRIDATISGGLLSAAPAHFSFVLPDACADLSADPPPVHASIPLGAFHLDITFAANCSPHPTAEGQRAIAAAVLKAAGLG